MSGDQIRTKTIFLSSLSVGHMMRHEGVNKIVDGTSTGYIDGVWSVRVTFTDSTSLVLPYHAAAATVDVITSFY